MRGSALVAAMGLTGVLALAGVLVHEGIGGLSGAPDSSSVRSAPSRGAVKTHLRSVALSTAANGNASVARQRTEPFSMLAVSWIDQDAAVRGTIQVRTRNLTTGQWSSWSRLDPDTGEGEDRPGVRGGTDPLWVGRSDGVQVRVARGTSHAASDGAPSVGPLPKGLRLDLIDPGHAAGDGLEPAAFVLADPTPSESPTASESPTPTSTDTASPSPGPTETTAPTSTPSPSPTNTVTVEPTVTPTTTPTGTPTPTASPSPTSTIPPAPPSTVPKPPITSRAGWHADESISPEEPNYLPGPVKAVVVHHTAGTNTYTCTGLQTPIKDVPDSAALIRGIYTNDVVGRGYRDIGYNFLIDKCGTIFEGRKGGVDRPVYGAHARGWNSETSGMAVLGNFNDATPSTATLTSIARLAAWKLGQYGADPAGTVSMTAGDTNLHSYYFRYFTNGSSYTFPRIVGHRDVNNTECPGTHLYAKLPTIRTWASGPVQGLALSSISGASKSGSSYYTKGAITAYWTATTPSSLIKRYELLVDGAVKATTAGSATSASATLAAGQHSVQIKAVHQSGKTAVTSPVSIIGDATAPTFTTRPSLSLRTGTVSSAAVPVRLAWKATDNTLVKNVQLTTPTALTFAPATTSWSLTAKPSTATTWTMRAADYAGNTTTASTIATPVILQETAATKSGTWSSVTSSNYLGGTSYSSATKNSSLSWTFTGRSATWIVSRGAGSGQAYVYVDGIRTATVDLHTTSTQYRYAIWTKTWSSNATHTVKIVVLATAGHPHVTVDGLAYLK